MSDYQPQEEREMWDAIVGAETSDYRTRLIVSAQIVQGHSLKVSRISGTRSYVASVDGVELPGAHGWTVDAVKAGVKRIERLEATS